MQYLCNRLIFGMFVFVLNTLFANDIDPASDPHTQPFLGTAVSGYELTFSDEFEGGAVDESKWYYRTGAKLWSTQLPANNSVSDGLFRIHLKKEKVGDTEYTGGGIITHKLFRYGYYETRMKVPKGQGWHSSFWMMRDKILNELPEGTVHIELDPVENDSSDPYHFQIDSHRWSPGKHRKFGTEQIHTTSPLTEFHVYGLEFTPTELRYFFDGELVGSTDASIFAHNDVNVWLSCLAGKLGKKTTGVDESTLPSETQYGYFRFFEKAAHATVEIVSPDPGSGIGVSNADESLNLAAKLILSQEGLSPIVSWERVSGPGTVQFESASSLETAASFSEPGYYVIKCTARVGEIENSTQLTVAVDAPIIQKVSHKLHGHVAPATHIRESIPENNNGQDNVIMVGKWKDKRSRGLLSFDLSRVEPGCVIERVELSLWNEKGLGDKIGPIELRELEGSFVEGTGDGWRLPEVGSGSSWISRNGQDLWNTPGGDINQVVLSRIHGYNVRDVALKVFGSTEKLVAAAQSALDSGEPLNLALVSPNTEKGRNAYAHFSSNDSPAEFRPVLTLTYTKKDQAKVGKKPNVLFIAFDDLRPELGCYGSELAITPNIDMLASQSLVFNRAYCQQAVCGPSRASLLTGTRPDTNGITHNYVKTRELNPDIVTLPQFFGKNGYTTVHTGKIFHHGDLDPQSWNRQPSVHRLDPSIKPGTKGFALQANKNEQKETFRKMTEKYGEVARFGLAMGPAYECADVEDNVYIDGYNTDLAIATLNELVEEGDKPFFLGLGFNKPHLNLIAPKKYWDLYDRESIPLAKHLEGPENGAAVGLHPSFELRVRSGIPKEGEIDVELSRTLRHAYLACVSYVDAQMGRIIEALDTSGVRDNTIIILWSDHGYHLGDMGLWCKATDYELATRVPMMVWTPDMPSGSKGKHIDSLVELVDMYPTLCELSGFEVPNHLEGTSFAPLIADPNQEWKTAAFSQFPSPALREWGSYPLRPAMRDTYFGPLLKQVEERIIDQMGDRWDRELFENDLTGYAMRTDRYRMIAWKNVKKPEADPIFVELYDHEVDPEETKNVAAQQPKVVAQLLEQFSRGWKGNLPNSEQ